MLLGPRNRSGRPSYGTTYTCLSASRMVFSFRGVLLRKGTETRSLAKEAMMERQEIERILLDAEALERFVDRAKLLIPPDGPVALTAERTSQIRPASTTPYARRADEEAIRLTDMARIQQRGLLADAGRVLPELVGQSPDKALSILVEKYKQDPSQQNQFLVQDAINRLTHVASLDAKRQKLVAEAIKVLTSVKLESQGEAEAKDSVWSNLYEHSDFEGRSIFAYLGPNSIYQSIRGNSLKNVDLHDRISSLTLDASTGEVRGDVILFQHDRFFGRFTAVRTNASNPTQQVSVSYVGGHINDRTSSILLVRRFADELVYSLGTLGAGQQIVNAIADVEKIKKVKGDPILTWDMWPTGGDAHPNDPDKRFIQVKIPVEIEVNNWFNYDAELWLWFYLYIQTGQLRGYTAWYGAKVEGGIISGSVLDDVMDALEDKIGDIDSLLDSFLSIANLGASPFVLGPYSAVYLLPGDQTLFAGPALEGHVEDDVSIVLVKRPLPSIVTNSVIELF